MKLKITFLGAALCGLLFSNAARAQQSDAETSFNRWSVEALVGMNKPLSPFTPGYYTTNTGKKLHIGGLRHYDLGVRYMLSETFGVRADFTYDGYTEPSGSGSLPFDTRQYLFALQGVLNLGQIFDFPSFTQRFGLLARVGGQISRFDVASGANDGRWERNGGFIVGITPQYRLHPRVALQLDLGYQLNIKQHLKWDGASGTDNNLVGSKLTMAAGLSFYLGKNDRHADWHKRHTATVQDDEAYQSLLNRVKTLEEKPVETEDEATKVAQELQQKLNELNGRTEALETVVAKPAEAVKEDAYVVFFDLNSAVVKQAYLPVITAAIEALLTNKETVAEIKGFTDPRGGEGLNLNLSERRAAAVAAVLMAGGVPQERIIVKGEGVDTRFEGQDETGMQLNRRVEVRLVK